MNQTGENSATEPLLSLDHPFWEKHKTITIF